ncbi:hypothetical protein P9112_004290 [Eukaryota sp. TZLM1-RC]
MLFSGPPLLFSKIIHFAPSLSLPIKSEQSETIAEHCHLNYTSGCVFESVFLILHGFKFNNYAVTNGISICFQFVRDDLAGLTFKPDSNIAKISVSDFNHLDSEDYSDKNVVFGDLGRRDLIQFGAQSEESNSNPLKKYEWMSLTNGEWSRLNRKHKQVLQFCVRQNNGNSEDQTMTIEEWNS